MIIKRSKKTKKLDLKEKKLVFFPKNVFEEIHGFTAQKYTLNLTVQLDRNPTQIIEYDDLDEYKAIFEGLELGTEATRTGIIDNAIKSKYIELKKDTYYIQKAYLQFTYFINNIIDKN